MTWLPEWRVTVGDDVYTTVTSASFASGRLDIDRQPTAGYCQIEIINTTGAAFTVNVTEQVTLELKNSSGTYVTVFGGEVSDFNIGVRSPEESAFITTGTILGIGSLSRLSKTIFNTALAEGLDGAQIATILNSSLNLSWAEVTPTLTWATYPSTTTWNDAESYIGTIDSGSYTMVNLAASETAKSQTLVDQIATSALGQIYEDRFGNVNYDDQDHRADYLASFGYTVLDASYSSPSTIKSTTQISRIRNSLIYKYGSGYASTYSTSDADSIASYGLFERSQDSNIKTLANITAIAGRELTLRKTPQGQLGAISFRLDNPSMTDAVRNSLISAFFGQPVSITNLPSNLLNGQFDGFIENITMKANPTFVDITLYVSPAAFSLPTIFDNYSLAQTVTTAGNTTFTVPSGVTQLAVLMKGYGGNGANGQNGANNFGGAGGAGGSGGGAGAFWNYAVTAGQTYTVNLDFAGTKRVSFGSLMAVTSGTNGTTGGSSVSGGDLYSRDASVVNYTSAAGTASGAAGASRSTTGNGNNAFDASGSGAVLVLPDSIGLPSNFAAGSGGGGGGGGACDTGGFNFVFGGGGGLAGTGGGQGGNGGDAAEFEVNAYGGQDTSGTGNGGGGGGGGGFKKNVGTGNGGTGSTATGAIVFIYTR